MCGECSVAARCICTAQGSSPRVRGMRRSARRRRPLTRIIPACAGNATPQRPPARPPRDHPRVCGECGPQPYRVGQDDGSSPRVRGMRSPAAPRQPARWIIPACAGNAASRRRRGRWGPDHPRVCGECAYHSPASFCVNGSSPRVRGMLMITRNAGRTVGSSPRVRGMRLRDEQRHRGGGIIPACAGNAVEITCPSWEPRDHPRVCGECPHGDRSGGCVAGSSPRVRGMPWCADGWREGVRIIPACAGNAMGIPHASATYRDHPRVCGECSITRVSCDWDWGSSPRVRGMRERADRRPRRSSDHPRVCGECLCMLIVTDRACGSSPRVRGMRVLVGPFVLDRRIIPACAGNAGGPAGHRTRPPDHPRVCGECASRAAIVAYPTGSSPRVRGMRRVVRRGVRPGGIIPACAGNASPRTACRWSARDHPRVCGECLIETKPINVEVGSSPRVRGMGVPQEVREPEARIIPACAGNARYPSCRHGPRSDHPRVCGECNADPQSLTIGGGSSPRVRGMLEQPG